ncbi:MFS transporter [Paenibacillus herberti]|uniref:MFS transporter n=1 Tax=Paenibacillus herberti TaxID=1619309 RepID=A0A229NT62_9BACL|nr:MFS transporter [Paenibacillus herberti]OXM13036.1 MFS transporter [Paenibacillus herberti]
MDKKAVRGWVWYDWANSAFATTMLAAVMPVYYESVAGSGLAGNLAQTYWANTQSIAMLLVAVLSPLAGAAADLSRSKLRFLVAFTILGAVSSSLMAFAGEGDWLFASSLLVLGIVGFSTGNTFYDALLRDGVPEEQRHAVSARGYAYGYAGGGVLLAINLLMILQWERLGFPSKTAATQLVFATVGVWWLLFALPLFTRWKEPRPTEEKGGSMSVLSAAGASFGRLGQSLRSLRHYPELLKYMAAFWFFNDGISTVIVMATIYGAGIGINSDDLILALLLTQFTGLPATLLFGRMVARYGAKRMLSGSLLVYLGIVVLGYFMTSSAHFFALAFLVGLVQGGSQASARSLYARLVPIDRSGEWFGFLALSSKFTSVLGPLVFSITGTLTGSSRAAILSVAAFFVIGFALLQLVNFQRGAEQAALVVPDAGSGTGADGGGGGLQA